MLETELAAGRELDAQIAEQVMGWQWFDIVGTAVLIPPYRLEEMRSSPYLYKELSDGPGTRQRQYVDGVWFGDSRQLIPAYTRFGHYSTDIAAAWEVVEYLRDTRAAHWELLAVPTAYIATVVWDGEHGIARQQAATMPLAICRAALVALGA